MPIEATVQPHEIAPLAPDLPFETMMIETVFFDERGEEARRRRLPLQALLGPLRHRRRGVFRV
ncbi:hypothetical protein ORIO_07820 [Cereibacter azotoformans]|uniref:Uncharacterized protein n=1 Tax=Cereibacter azotoformans TaxID=43057 RepID=A0A2T5KDJ5_9RHOB|nr:hypothetical protein [Cereibacter azotoformans]AXQ93650.1 hypothetical protein D0Z66_07415 [Cereibacter sphaeroides]MBO4168578.1 hypothetical protein [Cereibacter azotoformans]PTR20432.1 hypothetical protein C8J28_102197 [Cereibacter azotoformans]UIJ31990.1 hypothetical protein LV780_07390 [Cereibacter azotoformans]ULB09822.1 hypothetical protein ORIO_07820 [Cereibacter azotoformans]